VFLHLRIELVLLAVVEPNTLPVAVFTVHISLITQKAQSQKLSLFS